MYMPKSSPVSVNNPVCLPSATQPPENPPEEGRIINVVVSEAMVVPWSKSPETNLHTNTCFGLDIGARKSPRSQMPICLQMTNNNVQQMDRIGPNLFALQV